MLIVCKCQLTQDSISAHKRRRHANYNLFFFLSSNETLSHYPSDHRLSMKLVTILFSLTTLLLLVVVTNAVPASSDRLPSRQQQQQKRESHPLSLPLRRYKGRKSHQIQRRQQPSFSTLDGGNDTVRVTPGLYDMAMTEFAIPISIGTPAREFLLLFDTGSADTWVVGPSCTNATTCAADNGKAHKPIIDVKAGADFYSTLQCMIHMHPPPTHPPLMTLSSAMLSAAPMAPMLWIESL